MTPLKRCLQAKHTVFFLDYTGPPGFVEAVAQVAARVIVLDHHKTAQEHLQGRDDLPASVELHIDMERSGASLARDFFCSKQVHLAPPVFAANSVLPMPIHVVDCWHELAFWLGACTVLAHWQ